MNHPTLQTRSIVTQGRRGVYNGAETELSFGDTAAELSVLRSGCGVFELSWRAKVSVTGKDRVRWLHNMVTNNVRDLPVNRGAYNFVLNAQGRILGDMYIYNRGESILLDTDRAQVEPLITAMKRFIIMDKVEMSVAAEISALGICGPRTAEVLAGAGLDVRDLAPLEIREQRLGDLDLMVTRGPENKPGWYEIWTRNEAEFSALETKLLSAGARPVGAEALELWRVLHGIPHYGQDIRDRDLPQETGQTQALSFTKGCYIGQEIVERIRSRGHLHRTFVGFEFASDPSPITGPIGEGRPAAEVRSIALIPGASGEKAIGLGYVRREIAAEGQVEVNGQKARIVELPFTI